MEKKKRKEKTMASVLKQVTYGPITIVGMCIIFFYCAIQILKFLGVSQGVYGPFFLFYVLLIACILVLPNANPEP